MRQSGSLISFRMSGKAVWKRILLTALTLLLQIWVLSEYLWWKMKVCKPKICGNITNLFSCYILMFFIDLSSIGFEVCEYFMMNEYFFLPTTLSAKGEYVFTRLSRSLTKSIITTELGLYFSMDFNGLVLKEPSRSTHKSNSFQRFLRVQVIESWLYFKI